MVVRHEMEGGGGRVEVFRDEGPTVEDAIRTRLHYPKQRGPFWARRPLELPFQTSPLHFESVTDIVVTNGPRSNQVFEDSYGWSEEGVGKLTNYIAIAQSGGRQFLIRGKDELLSGPYSQIHVKAYTANLNNWIVVGEAEGRQELHLFDGQGEVAPASGENTEVLSSKKIEVYEPNSQDLTATVVATGDDGKQSLLFINRDSVLPALAGMDQIKYFSSRGYGDNRLLLFMAALKGEASFNVFSSSGQLIHTVPLDPRGLDLDKVGIYHFDPADSMDIIWNYPKNEKPRAYYRNGRLLAEKCIAFSDKSGRGQENWLAVTEPEANVRAVVLNGQIIHQTPLELSEVSYHADGLGAVVFAKKGTPQEGRRPEVVGYEVLCLGPDGGRFLIQELDTSPWFNYKSGKLIAHVKIGGIKQRVEITVPADESEPPVTVILAEPAAA